MGKPTEDIFLKAVNTIRIKDKRYDLKAYYFIRSALNYTIKKIHNHNDGESTHVSTEQLLEGIREFALSQYGPMSLTVLNNWGFFRCEDFGSTIFNLIDEKIFTRTENDTIRDFEGGYDFHKTFALPFEPKSPINRTLKKPRKQKVIKSELEPEAALLN